jgi:hypothetical protein
MEVQVMNFLPTLQPRVGQHPKSPFWIGPATSLQRQAGRQQHHVRQQSGMGRLYLGQGGDVELGNQ